MSDKRKIILTSGSAPGETGQIDFKPRIDDANPLNGVTIKGPDSVGATPITMTLPSSINAGVIKTDGSGNLSTGTISGSEISSIPASKIDSLTPNRAAQSDSGGVLTSSSVTATELSYVSGVTSSIQTQLDSKASDSSLTTHIADTAAHSSTSANTPSRIVSRDASGDFSASKININELDVNAPATLNIGASVGANDINIGGITSTVKIPGNFEVDGSTTFINSTNLDVTDPLITINKDGTDLSSEGSGIQVDRVGTKGSLIYANAATSKFKVGDQGSEKEVATISDAQIITNKDIDGQTAANNRRITLPQDTYSNLTGLTRKAGTLLYANDQKKAYIDDGTVLRPVGSGSGSGGINFIGLDTNFQFLNSDDVDAETSVGNWATYADAAGSMPVDMTGGSPNITLARTTTVGEVLNGSGSFEVTKDAANRQGQGVSVLTNIPLGYRGKRASISLPLKIISGSLVEGDLKCFLYDITNSQVLTPINNDILTSSTLNMGVDIPSNCAQIRFGFHFASTSASEVNFSFDDVFVGPKDLILGATITDEIDESSLISFDNFGTTTNHSIFTRQVGNKLQIRGSFTSGTSVASPAAIILPNKYKIDSSKFNTDHSALGILHYQGNGGAGGVFTLNYSVTLYYDGSDISKIYMGAQSGTTNGEFIPVNASTLLASGGVGNFYLEVPIQGFSSNVINGNSVSFNASSLAANGSNVTATPTLLGEFRTLIKDNAAFTLSDDATAQSSASIAADGFHIYATSGSGAGTSGQPNSISLFVGKNKQVKFQFYANTGRTGEISTDVWVTSIEVGLHKHYNPTTGIATVQLALLGGNVTRYVGDTFSETSGGTGASDCYFDIIVSENNLPLISQVTENEVEVNTPSGWGSTNTYVRLFSVISKQNGDAISVVNSATLGTYFTINKDGVYALSYLSDYTSSTLTFYITKNESTLNANPTSVGASVVSFGYGATANSYGFQTTSVVNLRAGDIIRPMTDVTAAGGASVAADTKFRITKVA